MKNRTMLFCALFFMMHCSPEIMPDTVALLLPGNMLVDQQITVMYNTAATKAKLNATDPIQAQVLVLSDQKKPVLLQIPLQRKGAIYEGRIQHLPGDAQMLLCRFTADDKIDDNEGHNWEYFIFGKQGRPVQGSHLQKSMLLQNGGISGFTYPQNLHEAGIELEAELALYPQNLRAKSASWELLLSPPISMSNVERVQNELRQAYEAAAGDDETLAQLLPFFLRTGQDYIAQQIIDEALSLMPRGKVAKVVKKMVIEKESDPVQKAALLQTFHREFPDARD